MTVTRVSDNLFRGPRPKTLSDIKYLMSLGVNTFINLESGPYEEFHDDDYEKMLPEDYGLTFERIHCSDVMWPKAWQVALFLRIMQLPEVTVYIHCEHGKDRTGFMVACYRMIVQEWSYLKAKAEMFAMGFHKFPYFYWLPALKKYEVKKKEV